MKEKLTLIIFAILLAALLLFPNTASGAAASALGVWWDAVLPSLLPFMLLCRLLQESGLLSGVSFPGLRLLGLDGRLGGAALLGALSGYPAGATLANDGPSGSALYAFLALCNLPGPMFVSGVVAGKWLKLPGAAPMLLAQYFAALCCCALLTPSEAGRQEIKEAERMNISRAFPTAMLSAWNAALAAGGSMALFSALFAITAESGLLALPGREAVCAAWLDMTLGVQKLCALPLETDVRAALCAAAMTFGGCSVAAQTCALCDASMPVYMLLKLLQGLLAGALCLLLLRSPGALWLPECALAFCLCLAFRRAGGARRGRGAERRAA